MWSQQQQQQTKPPDKQQDQQEQGPPSKRRRVTLACGNCRHRKSRCDGRRPQCSLCLELGCECVYEQAGVATNLTVGRSYLERLEKRLADIESTLKQVRTTQAELSPRCSDKAAESHGDGARDGLTSQDELRGADGNGDSTAGSTTTIGKTDSVTSSRAATAASSTAPRAVTPPPGSKRGHRVDAATSASATGNGFGELDTAEDSIDGMGAIKFTDEVDWGYFGPSSNIAFLRHISLAMARMDDLHQVMPSPTNRAHEVSGGMSVSRPHPVDRNDGGGGGGGSGDAGVDGRGSLLGSGITAGNGGGGSGHGSGSCGRGVARTSAVNIYALPSEARTWSLIREYFQKTGRLLPFVHEATFCATYFEMKKNNFTMARRTWLGLLNIILAMATTLHVDTTVSAEKRIEESDVYYQRAHGLCDKESRRNISLELVQYLLVLGQYLQGTQKSVQAWTVHGLAITTALQLGLQSPKTNKAFPPLECEIRKRVWFGCFLLDRTLSMTFGRPSMIHESYLKLELPITDMQMVGQEPQTEPTPQLDGLYFTATMYVWLFVASLQCLLRPLLTSGRKLYNVMFRIIDTCYGQNLGLEEFQTDSELISLVLRVEQDLEAWRNQLAHDQLSVYDAPVVPKDIEGVDADNKISARYPFVLSVRYHNLQILLHRHILEKLLETCGRSYYVRRRRGAADARTEGTPVSTFVATSATTSSASTTNAAASSATLPTPSSTAASASAPSISSSDRDKILQMGIGSVEACIHSAQVIISVVHTVVLSEGPRRDLLGAWNYSLFYTFNAALAIFAAMHVARCDIQHDAKRLARWEFVEGALPYFSMAIEALENLDRGNHVVARCVSYLSQLTLVPINPQLAAAAHMEAHAAQQQTPAQTAQTAQLANGAMGPVGGGHGGGSNSGSVHSHAVSGSGSGAGALYPYHHVHPHHSGGPGGLGGVNPHPFSVAGSSGTMQRQQQQLLPMEIDLSEFMLDTDFDLLNMAWLSS